MAYHHPLVEFRDGSVLPKAPWLKFIPWFRLLDFFSFRTILYIQNYFFEPFCSVISVQFSVICSLFPLLGHIFDITLQVQNINPTTGLSCKPEKSQKGWVSVNLHPISWKWPERALQSRTFLSFKTSLMFMNIVLANPRFHVFKKVHSVSIVFGR